MSEFSITHHFGAGVYAKETHIPAGCVLGQHKHKFDHLSILASGNATLSSPGRFDRILQGPSVITIPAGTEHTVKAITDCVWYCIHSTEERDVTRIDETLIASAGS
jgi:quercetin dioxygenase-like cupin family protein